MNTIKPGDRVVYHLDEGEQYAQTAIVVDHTAAEMTPPDDGMVLVRWSRTTLNWEYTEDLRVQ